MCVPVRSIQVAITKLLLIPQPPWRYASQVKRGLRKGNEEMAAEAQGKTMAPPASAHSDAIQFDAIMMISATVPQLYFSC